MMKITFFLFLMQPPRTLSTRLSDTFGAPDIITLDATLEQHDLIEKILEIQQALKSK
jgi:hypothetical protein